MTLEALFFDVGRTLLTEVPSRYEIYAQTARQRGRNLSAMTMKRVMRTAHGDIPARIGGAYRYTDAWFRAFIHRIFCQNLGLAPEVISDVSEELLEKFSQAETFRVFPGAHELLTELKGRGLKLGVISNWSERLGLLLERTELAGYFDVVVCSATEKMEKPDPDLFHLALERMGVKPEQALHTGDHPEQDGGAAAIGMEFVQIDHLRGADPSTPRDFPVVGSFDELHVHLNARLAG